MGKPFNKELEKINSTLNWSMGVNSNELKESIMANNLEKPLYIIGSGGSLSACYYAASLYQQHGQMAKAVTPLELYYAKNSIKNSNVLFISASGRNNDILFGYKTAVDCEPSNIFSISMKLDTPLEKLSNKTSIGKHFSFPLPAGKDGFLATNSLVAFFSILYNSFGKNGVGRTNETIVDDQFFEKLECFMKKVDSDFTFTILYGGWGHAVAVDLESKLAEAALADVLVSDVRNFGHGRHHWFAKRKQKSAIIALITPQEKEITLKTISLLPSDIPILEITSNAIDGYASIEMLVKSFYFIDALGKSQRIDPGRPGVPDFGSDLYHLNFQRYYSLKTKKSVEQEISAITRKANVPYYGYLNAEEKDYWHKAYQSFIAKLQKTFFGALIFDYDGTICSSENRLNGVDDITLGKLLEVLESGAMIGIATGRGKSAREDLEKKIPTEFWDRVVIGYYNCGEIGLLSQNNLPNKALPQNMILKHLFENLKSMNFISEIKIELKPEQIVVEIAEQKNWKKVRVPLIQYILSMNISNIQILESSHSIDIIDQTKTNKLNIIKYCQEKLAFLNKPTNCLCIGDKGKWPGNDYQLLSSEYSLSVDEVTSLPDTCWNISEKGMKNVESTLLILSYLKPSEKGIKFKIK